MVAIEFARQPKARNQEMLFMFNYGLRLGRPTALDPSGADPAPLEAVRQRVRTGPAARYRPRPILIKRAAPFGLCPQLDRP